jgi:Reverse transcriptase (RNA-dependent DNA polymerase)/Endonuclease-reverse transcriptase
MKCQLFATLCSIWLLQHSAGPFTAVSDSCSIECQPSLQPVTLQITVITAGRATCLELTFLMTDFHKVTGPCLVSHMPLSSLFVTKACCPHLHRRRRLGLLYFLLLIGGIEQNPGPPTPTNGLRPNNSATLHQSLNCGLLNVRSAVQKSALIHDQIETNNLDLLVLTETWIDSKAPAAIKKDIAPEGYNVLHVHRTGKKRGGGIALVYRSNLTVIPLAQSSDAAPTTFEVLRIKILSGTQRVNVVCVYRPPPSPNSLFFTEFSSLCTEIETLPGHVVLCGDFNCPGSSDTTIDARLEELLTSFNYFQHVHDVTRRGSGSTGNLLDLVISRADSNIITSDTSVMEVAFSDHYLVLFKLCLSCKRSFLRQFNFRDLKGIDADKFNDLLRRSSITMSPPTDVDMYLSQFESDVINALEAVAPLQTRTKRVGHKPTAKWMSAEANDAKKLSRRLQRRKLASKLDDDYIAYRKAARAATKAITTARANFLKHQVAESASDCKSLWRTAKSLLHTKKETPQLNKEDSQNLANSFTKFFSNKLTKVAADIASRLQILTSDSFSRIPVHPSRPVQCFSIVTSGEVCRLLHSMPATSSPLDFVPTSLLKSLPNTFSYYLAMLANLSFSQGHFPSALKIAQVTPLPKKPNLNTDDPSNYRPISNLNTIGKLLERLALARLRPQIITNPNFSTYQSAYRPKHSTETAALKIVNDLFSSADSSHATLLVSLDLTAAFDTINHGKLVTRLSNEYGFSGNVLSWIETYLLGRKQFVKVGPSSGTTTSCTTGVPQGSVLGPLLFSVYISPISRLIASYNIQHHKYADDTTLYVRLEPGSSSICPNLESCSMAVSSWFLEHDMQLNPSKSEAIIIGTVPQLKKFIPFRQVAIAGAPVPVSDNLKIIGLTLDKRLTFDRHVTNVCQESNFHIRALRHIRPSLDRATANTLACSIVNSRLDYCNSVLYGMSQHNLQRLQLIQNSLARVVCQAPSRCSATSLLKQLHWLPIQHRIEYKIATITHQALTQQSPDYLHALLSQHIPARNLRSASKSLLVIPTTRTTTGSRSFCVSAPTIWNALPDHLREIKSHDAFKTQLKTEHFKAAFIT